MKIVKELFIILAFSLSGEFLAKVSPVALPASVIGMALMLAAFGFKFLKEDQLGKTSDYLSANMAFFFMPVATAVVENYDVMKGVIVRLLVICFVCAFVTFWVTYGTVRLFRILLKSEGGEQ